MAFVSKRVTIPPLCDSTEPMDVGKLILIFQDENPLPSKPHPKANRCLSCCGLLADSECFQRGCKQPP